MKTSRKTGYLCSIFCVVLVLGTAGGVCQGWWPCTWSYGGYSQSIDLGALPHFALFPPVYYSRPVPRTYGYTPFASLPEFTTVLETRTAEPLVVRNPYVGLPALGATQTVPSVAAPQIVRNPFIQQSTDTPDAEHRLAGR